jgi:hypothetical protein
VILRVLRRTTFAHSKHKTQVPLLFSSEGQSCRHSTDWEGARRVACLLRSVNLPVQGLFGSWCFVHLRAIVTLITSISEFISVFEQPTSSLVLWSHHHPCHLLTSVFYLPIICSPSWGGAIVIHTTSWTGLCQILKRIVRTDSSQAIHPGQLPYL